VSDSVEGAAAQPVKFGKLLVFAVTALFALAIGMSVFSGLWSAASKVEVTPAPRELAGYHLDQAMEGPQAIEEISALHGEDIEVLDAWIAHYQGSASIWAARASSEEQAAKLLDDMVKGIGEGKSPFQGLRDLEIEGVATYTVTDGRQQHFFYQQGDQVIWVAAPRGGEQPFVLAALEKID
jgi:hypothetical protein